MSEKRTFRFAHRQARQLAAQFCMSAPDGWTATFQEPNKSREQEEKYHSMIADISRQCEFMGRKWGREEWKRLLIDAFARIKAAEGKPLRGWGTVMPSLDGSGFVQLGIQSRHFRKAEAAEFVEYLYSYGAENGVQWSEPEDEEYMRRYG
ncbi:MAG: hypothetical protein ABS69_10675 [Nitrosomonadales bacterium SCN 54-20]|nr:MAG: hypothetical protein ABS69_10675 [Nitrosomonadales bacterium SCN 54-20]